MAAAVLETVTIPRASSPLTAASFPPIVSSSVFALSGGRSSVKLPESRGLRIQSARFSGSIHKVDTLVSYKNDELDEQ